MQPADSIDILEQDIADYSYQLFDILLLDRTSNRNIIWATADYADMGEQYYPRKQILPNLIIGCNTRLIQPRTAKAQSNQISRTRNMAEVFTPSWVCNAQNNLVDEAWFGRKNVFNVSDGVTWQPIKDPIVFPSKPGRTWQDYVDANRMEVSCGEAPYLVSRYDTSTGQMIPLQERIGLLDRKLRVVNENAADEREWLVWTRRAFESIYAYEFQGDNLLLARENLLCTFIDCIRFKLSRDPSLQEQKEIANIISWNIWQMDAMTYTIPYGKEKVIQLFQDDCIEDQAEQDEVFSRLCQIKDWRTGELLKYKSLLKEARQ